MERSVLFWGLEKLMSLKFPYYRQQSAVLVQPLSKYHWHSTKLEQIIITFVRIQKRPQLIKTILESFKNKTGGITLQFDVIDFKLYHKFRTGWYGTKTDTDQ